MKMPGTIYSSVFLLCFLMLVNSCKKSDQKDDPTLIGTVTDIDGNLYHTVTIRTQVWMVENLKTTKYRNGDPIPNVTGQATWAALTNGAYCWYNFDAATYKASRGALYNWYAVNDSRKIAPTGWHVPTDAEWATLIASLGGESVAGGELKETGTSHWLGTNTGATNNSGFTAIPGGGRDSDGAFSQIDHFGIWWTSSEYSATDAWYWLASNDLYNVFRISDSKLVGFSVRCLKD